MAIPDLSFCGLYTHAQVQQEVDTAVIRAVTIANSRALELLLEGEARHEREMNEAVARAVAATQQRVRHVAVVGREAVGKSALVSSLVRLQPPDAAPNVGVTTTRLIPYDSLEFRGRVIWDTPGFGTPSFPVETYVRDAGLEYFNIFVLVYLPPFTEVDAMLVAELKARGFLYVLVRTKIDEDGHDVATPPDHPVLDDPDRDSPIAVSTRRAHAHTITNLKSVLHARLLDAPVHAQEATVVDVADDANVADGAAFAGVFAA